MVMWLMLCMGFILVVVLVMNILLQMQSMLWLIGCRFIGMLRLWVICSMLLCVMLLRIDEVRWFVISVLLSMMKMFLLVFLQIMLFWLSMMFLVKLFLCVLIEMNEFVMYCLLILLSGEVVDGEKWCYELMVMLMFCLIVLVLRQWFYLIVKMVSLIGEFIGQRLRVFVLWQKKGWMQQELRLLWVIVLMQSCLSFVMLQLSGVMCRMWVLLMRCLMCLCRWKIEVLFGVLQV